MYIKVIVTAGAKKEKVERKNENTFLISVKEEAKGNRANVRVCELLGEQYGCTSREVRIVNGHQHPHKLISINEKHHDVT